MRSTQVVALGACAFVGWIGMASHAAAEELPVEPVVEQSAPAVPEADVAQSAPAVDESAPAVDQSAPAVDEAPVPTDPTSGSIPTGTLDDGSTVAQAGPVAPVQEQVVVAAAAPVAAATPVQALPETGSNTTLAVAAAVLCALGTSLMAGARRRL